MGQALDVTQFDYPSPPWRMHGFAVMRPVVVVASEIALPPQLEIVQRAGRAAGLLAYVEYRAPSALTYSELAFLPCSVRPKGERRPMGQYVAAMYVDSETSVAAGRTIWGLPKRLASFERSANRVRIHGDDGMRLELSFHLLPAMKTLRSRTTTLQVQAGRVVRFRGEFESQVCPASMKISRFTAGDAAWRGFRGVGHFSRPALAMPAFSSRMLAPDFPGAAGDRDADTRVDRVVEEK